MSDGWDLRAFLAARDIPPGHEVVFLEYVAGEPRAAARYEARCRCGLKMSSNDRLIRAGIVDEHWDRVRARVAGPADLPKPDELETAGDTGPGRPLRLPKRPPPSEPDDTEEAAREAS